MAASGELTALTLELPLAGGAPGWGRQVSPPALRMLYIPLIDLPDRAVFVGQGTVPPQP